MKDVFSELDGFIVVVSVLSTLGEAESVTEEWDTSMSAAFKVMIVALKSHAHNQAVFEVCCTVSVVDRVV